MAGKGKFSDFGWHNEFHNDTKKSKPANCVFLDENGRICRNKKSPYYLSKCFIASNCPLRKKEPNLEKNDKKDDDLYWY